MTIPSLYRKQGFTLVELILIIVLISIISVAALPKFFNNNDFEQKVFFNDTLNALRYAQKTAIATGCNVRISINNNSYQLLRANTCSSDDFSLLLTVPDPSTGASSFSGSQNNVTLTAINPTTTFDSLGRADAGNTITVSTLQITVIAATGFSYDSTP